MQGISKLIVRLPYAKQIARLTRQTQTNTPGFGPVSFSDGNLNAAVPATGILAPTNMSMSAVTAPPGATFARVTGIVNIVDFPAAPFAGDGLLRISIPSVSIPNLAILPSNPQVSLLANRLSELTDEKQFTFILWAAAADLESAWDVRFITDDSSGWSANVNVPTTLSGFCYASIEWLFGASPV